MYGIAYLQAYEIRRKAEWNHNGVMYAIKPKKSFRIFAGGDSKKFGGAELTEFYLRKTASKISTTVDFLLKQKVALFLQAPHSTKTNTDPFGSVFVLAVANHYDAKKNLPFMILNYGF